MSRFLGIYPTVPPTPREEALYLDVVAISRALGVTFQPGQVEVYWWRREVQEPLGFTEHTTPVCVWLGTGSVDAEQIVSTTAHELKHARDHLDGLDLLKPEAEERAQVFAERVLIRWQAQQRPRSTTYSQPRVSMRATDDRISHMRTMSPALDLASVPALAGNAVKRIDLSQLARRRRLASNQRSNYHWVLSDSAITRLTAAVALLDEVLAGDEDLEIQTLRNCRNHLAARLESAGADMPGW